MYTKHTIGATTPRMIIRNIPTQSVVLTKGSSMDSPLAEYLDGIRTMFHAHRTMQSTENLISVSFQ